MKVIVDSNIFFSALLKEQNKFRNLLLLNDKIDFFTCHFLIVELFKYKEKIIKASKMEEEAILELFYELLKRINLYNETLISDENYYQAYDLCKDIDKKDIPFVALTLEINGFLWTGDKKLREGLKSKNFINLYTSY